MANLLPSTITSRQGGAALTEALEQLEQRLRRWAGDATAYAALLEQVYGVDGAGAAATGLRGRLLGEGLGLSLEAATLPGLSGAYAAADSAAAEVVLLDRRWLTTATAAQLEAVLLEELGHALDRWLRGSSDSPGDEGEIFSALLRGQTPAAVSFSENDQRWITFDGQQRSVEAAVLLDSTPPQLALNGSVRPAFADSSLGFGLLPDVGDVASPTFVDIDADGDLDAFIGNYSGDTLFFENTGGRALAAFAGSSLGFGLPHVRYLASPTFVDIDADGDLDAFIGSTDGNTIFCLNTGSPAAAAFAGSSLGFGLPDVGFDASPAFVDIDADGDLDTFIGNQDGNTIFCLNTGSPVAAAFAGSSLGFGLPDVGFSASPTFVDIDADGDLDAFIGNSAGNTIFCLNTGSPMAAAFAGSSLGFGLPDVGYSASPTFVDIDADGDLDALIGAGDGSTLFFRNIGGGLSSQTGDGIYYPGDVITIELPFTETVVVDTSLGLPTLLLETGSIDRAAVYSGGSGSNRLVFTYTVQIGDSSSDLDVVSAAALQLNGATIRDLAGNNASLTLPAPGTPGSLGANANIVIAADTTPPRPVAGQRFRWFLERLQSAPCRPLRQAHLCRYRWRRRR